MDPFKVIEQRVSDGFVLDENGRWVHMSQKGSSEKRFMEELSKGNVLLEGKWVPIAEAKLWAVRKPEPIENSSVNSYYAPPPIVPPAPVTEQSIFEAMETVLETKSLELSSLSDEEEDREDELNETAYLTVEQIDAAHQGDLPTSEPRDSAKEALEKIIPDIPTEVMDKELATEVEQMLLFDWSKSAATEQSKYAMEYIDTLSNTLKRRKMYQVLSIASIIIAIISAILLIFVQA